MFSALRSDTVALVNLWLSVSVIVCRLVNELRGWVLGHEEELRRQREVVQMENARSRPTRKKYYPPRKLKAALHGADDASHVYHPRYDSAVCCHSTVFD